MLNCTYETVSSDHRTANISPMRPHQIRHRQPLIINIATWHHLQLPKKTLKNSQFSFKIGLKCLYLQ